MLIRIPFVVIFPVVFFSILLIAVFLYRRYLSPYLKSIFTQEDGMCDPTSRQDIFPHCQLCYGHHQHDQGNSLVSVENESSSLNSTDVQLAIADGLGEIFQPHFVDINISVKKLSLDPHLSDVTTRVDCVASTLSIQSQELAKSSPETLPFGGGHHAHVSTLNPNLLEYQAVEANSIAEGVIAVGDRRPSVLSGGLSDRKETNQLTLRKISAGGKEELIQINPASIEPSMLPVRMAPPSHSPPSIISHRPSFQNNRLNKRNSYHERPPVHLFNPTGLRANATVTHGSIAFPIPHVPIIQAPPRSRKKNYQKRQRPDSLKLASATLHRKRSGSPGQFTAISGVRPTTAVSMLAIKSAPLVTSPKVEEIGPNSATASGDQGKSDLTPGLFEVWEGFPAKTATAKAVVFKPSRPQPPKIVIPPPRTSVASASPITVPRASTSEKRLYPSLGPCLKAQVSPLGSKRFNAERRASKITYLADVVKENEAKGKSATLQTTIIYERETEETFSSFRRIPRGGLV